MAHTFPPYSTQSKEIKDDTKEKKDIASGDKVKSGSIFGSIEDKDTHDSPFNERSNNESGLTSESASIVLKFEKDTT